MNAAVVPTNVVSDQQDIKTSMGTKTTVVKINNETEEYELARQNIIDKLHRWGLRFYSIFVVSYLAVLIFYSWTLSVLRDWQKQCVNHTNIEEFKTEHLQIHLFMIAYILIIITSAFFSELNFIGRHRLIQLWRESKLALSRIGIFTGVNLIFIMETYALLWFLPNVSIKEYFKEEYAPYKSPKSYFYFQLATIWCIFQLNIANIIMFWISSQKINIKGNTTPSIDTIPDDKMADIPKKCSVVTSVT